MVDWYSQQKDIQSLQLVSLQRPPFEVQAVGIENKQWKPMIQSFLNDI